jgi:hypothetical protein
MSMGGTLSVTADVRAPIFYDSNNTGYYLDPNSSGLALRTSGYWIADSTAWAGDIDGKIQRHNNSWYFSASNFWVFRATSGAEPFTVSQGGTAIAAADMRAPIFYDNNDTGYYLDPASTGLALKVNGNIECFARSAAWAEGVRIRVPTRANWGGIRFTRDEANSNGNWAIGYTGIDSTDDLTFWGNLNGAEGMRARLSQAGNLTVYGATTANQSYAQIFYDSQNGAYYLDPSSTGTSLNVAGNIIGVGELRTSGQITNANYMVGGSQNGAVNIGRIDLNYRWEGTVWGSTTTLGLLANCADYWEFGIHDSGARVVSPLYYDGGARFLMGRDIGWGTTYIEAASNFRAPLFYDSNNTAYYLDPAATSVLNQAQFVNRISIGDGNGTPFLNAGSPGVWLSYNGGVNIFMGSESSTVAGFYIAGDWRLRVNSSGDVTAGGNVTAYSDARLKKDVETIGDALGLVRKMRGVTYTRIDTDKAGVGVIAQEMLEVMPQVVQQGIGDNDTLSVAYGNLVGVLIEAIKELEARVAELEGK